MIKQMSWYLPTYIIKPNNSYTSDIKWSIHIKVSLYWVYYFNFTSVWQSLYQSNTVKAQKEQGKQTQALSIYIIMTSIIYTWNEWDSSVGLR